MDKYKKEIFKTILTDSLNICGMENKKATCICMDIEEMEYILKLINDEENRAFARMLEKEHKLKKEKENV